MFFYQDLGSPTAAMFIPLAQGGRVSGRTPGNQGRFVAVAPDAGV